MTLYTIKIKDLHVHPIIGVYEYERDAGQEIILNMTIYHTRPEITDDLSTTFDYDSVVKEIEAYSQTEQPFLIETFGNAIAEMCLKNKLVQEVEIEVIKPHALKNGTVSTVVKKTK